MTENLSLGKKGKSGEIDFSKIKSGIKKKDLLEGIEPKLKSVFEQIINKIDSNPDDNMLSREELQSFYEELDKLSKGNGNLSSREARKYQINGEKIGKKGKDALFALLNKLSELSKEVQDITYETIDGKQVEVILYNNNKTEKVFPDGSRIITITKGNSKVSTTYDKDDNKKEETIAEGDWEETTTYDAGKKTKVVLENPKKHEKTTVYLDSSENPVKKEKQKGSITETYEKSEVNGKEQWLLTEKTENVNGFEQKTVCEYDDAGNKIRESIKTSSGSIEKTYNSDGTSTEIISNYGEPVHTIKREKDRSYSDNFQEGNAEVTDYYNPESRHIAQNKTVDGTSYNVRYDEAGNTLGVIVQFGETIQQIAERFGVSVKDLIKVNASKVKGKYPNASFNAGEEIKIPRKLEADAPALQGRKSRDEVLAEYRADRQRRAEEARRRAEAEAARRAEEEQQQKSKPQKYTLPSGRYVTVQRGKVKYYAADGTQLKKEYFESKEGKVVDMKPSGRYIITIGGKSRYFAADGTELKESYFKSVEAKEAKQRTHAAKVQKDSAKQIVDELKDAIRGWNDTDKIQRVIARIDNPEELAEVNRLLAAEGYETTDLYSPIERFIYEENNHSYVHAYNSSDFLERTVQKWIDNGTLRGQEAINAQARMAARVIFDGGDGFGTDCEKIKKGVRMIKCPKPTGDEKKDRAAAKAVYDKVNEILVRHRTFYGLGSPCKNLRDYCEGEMWESECRYLDGILAENNAIQGKEKAQAIHDLTEEAVAGAGTDIEYLTQAIKAINSREDRIAVEAKLKEYCEKHNVKPQYKGQAYLQAILYDECDTFMGLARDHKEIRKFNEMLIEQGAYNEQEIINLRAEQAALQIFEGDFDNVKDAMQQVKDPKVYSRMCEIFKQVAGKSLDSFLIEKLGQEKSDLAKAELAANNVIAGKEAADIAYRLILNSDFDKRAMGFKAIRNEEVARIVDGYLKTRGSSLAKVLEQFNKEKAEYKAKAELWDGLGKFILPPVIAETISDNYRENTDVSDNMYVTASEPQKLTDAQKAAYKMTVQIFEQKLNQMKADYQKALDSQGAVSGAINAFCEMYGLGTTREEIEARIEHDTETLRLLKLAAEGKLAKVENGKTVPVSFESVFAERNVGTNFDAAKVEKVAKQAETMVAMDYAKENIAICWDELSNAKTTAQLAVAIIDTLEKLSAMSGQELSLEALGYSIKNGMIVDKSGFPVVASKLQEIAAQLKQGLSDISKSLFGVEIPLNSSYDKVNDILSKGYDSKMESFKQEFKDAFGQEVPDEILEDYMSTINAGMTVINVGVLIGAMVAAPFTGGGSLAVFAMTAAASMGLNALENSTDADGYTNSEWTSDAAQAMWDGALSAIGFKIGQFAEAFATGSRMAASQNKWIAWLAKQPKGSLTSRLANIPKNQLGKVASKAKEIADKIQAYSGKIGKNVLEAKKAQILAKNPGANLNSVGKASVLFARAEACGIEVSSDMVQSLVQTYCMTGEFDEESFLMALCMSIGANIVGHGVAAKQADVSGGSKTGNSPKSDNSSAPKADDANAPKAEDADTAKSGESGRAAENTSAAQDAKTHSFSKEEIEGFANIEAKNVKELEAKLKSQGFEREMIGQNGFVVTTNDEIYCSFINKETGIRYVFKYDNDRMIPHRMISTDVNTGAIYNTIEFKRDAEGNIIETIEKNKPKEAEAPKSEEPHADEKVQDEKVQDENPAPDSSYSVRDENGAVIHIDTADGVPVKAHVGSKEYDIKDGKFTTDDGIEYEVGDGGIKRTNSSSGAKEEVKTDNNSTGKTENSNSSPKTYDQMNEDELFAEYFRLKMEVTYAPMSNSAKAANINEMKKIAAHLEQKGYKIEGDKLVKINDEAPKGKPDNSAEEGEAVHKPKFSATELRQKLGERLYKIYQKAEEMIKNLRTINDYNIAKTYIKAQFAKFNDVMTDLLESLEAAAKKLGILAKRTVFGETGSKYFSQRDVNNFINEKVESPRDLYNRMLAAGFESNRATHFSKTQAFISMYDPKGNNLYTYIYDGQGNLIHKSLCKATRHPDGSYTRHSDLIVEYNNGKATVNIEEGGKTIYSKHVTPQSSRRADRSSHIDPEKAKAYAKFDKNSPIHVLREGRTVDLDQNRQYLLDLNNLPQLTLLDGTTVDLNSAQIKNRIASLQEGEYITIGREGDIRLNNASNNVSRHHILITRQNGRIVMKDVSANGSTKCYSKPAGSNYDFGAGKGGRKGTNVYIYETIDDLKHQMRNVLNVFSINSQNKIINDMINKGTCRLQKNGAEYIFTMKGHTVRVDEFDINAKYNIKETKIDDYNTQTTYDIDDLNDIWWAMSDKMPRFSPETQSYIVNKLSNGETCRLTKGGIAYEFSIDANGRITVKEHNYVRYNYDNGGNNDYNSGRSENANRQNRSEGSSGSNRGQRANNSAGRMSDVQKQERIHTIESILERADDIEKFKTKFANILSSGFKVTDEAGVQELKKTTRFIKAFWHTDIGTGAPSDLQVICDELFNMTNGKYVVMGESRMGTPAEVNAMLDKLRELTNLDALRKELSELKG